jgi:2-dehydropantoate 2-reductase
VAVQWHILGAGAIGQLLACKFLRAGIPTRLLCRDAGAAAVFEQGIELQDNSGSQRVPVAAISLDQLETIRGLFITTKANQALAAFQQVQHLLQTGTPVILLHNGMGVYEQLAQLYPPQALFCGTTTAAAYRAGPAQLVLAGHGETRIGQFSGESAPAWFADFANSKEAFIWEKDIGQSLWRKLLVNCAINPLTAVHQCRNGELLENPEFRAQATQLCAELSAVCRARGEVSLAQEIQDCAFEVMRSTSQNQSSMLQDVLHQRPTEIEFINGYLCREAKSLGVPCPLNQQLWKQLSQGTAH